jgi:hypothetical protein
VLTGVQKCWQVHQLPFDTCANFCVSQPARLCYHAAQAAEDDDAAGAGDTADVEAEVAAAMEAVAKPEPMKVTDADVLNALIEKGVITKEALIQALAVAALSADDGQAEEPGLV